MHITRNVGMILLAILLILWGLVQLVPSLGGVGIHPGDPRHRSRHLHPAGPLGSLSPGQPAGWLHQ